jgi:NADH:ubiquinone oxidoreductase subunit 5 (subunit L)/multisubunit Na+/H+ antiporter MnhA subunit
MDALVILIIFLPLAAAIIVGIGHLFAVIDNEKSETITANISSWALSLSCLMSLFLVVAGLLGKNTGYISIGRWLSVDELTIRINFNTNGLHGYFSLLFSFLIAIIGSFSINFMKREAGFHRFFFCLSLFAFAMQLIVLSANAVGTFIGWEITGLCAWLFIAYDYSSPGVASNASRVFVSNCIGDVSFILGISFYYLWMGDINWDALYATDNPPGSGQATVIALCFTVAAFAKSSALPFTSVLSRAIEGPVPSLGLLYGVVMVHAGVYLVLIVQPVFEQAVFARGVLVVAGFATAVYSYVVGLSRADVRSSLVYSVSAQLGLMFFECGIGLWQLAAWHLCAHAMVRCTQFLNMPSSLPVCGRSTSTTELKTATDKFSWLYVTSLQGFWLDSIIDMALLKPVQRLADDLCYFDDQVLERVMGIPAPAINVLSAFALLDGKSQDSDFGEFLPGSGLAGKLALWLAALLHWLENFFILQGMSKSSIHYGRKIGHALNQFERLILRPRYLVLFVFITFLVGF